MNIKKALSLLLLLAFTALVLSACSADPIVGSWGNDKTVFTFDKDGTGVVMTVDDYTPIPISYTVSSNTLTVTLTYLRETEVFYYEFVDGALILKQGESVMTLTKR